MRKFFSGLALLGTVILFTACQDELSGLGGDSAQDKLTVGKNVVAFRLGGNTSTTRAEGTHTIVAPTNVIDLPAAEDENTSLCLVETVTSLDASAFDATAAVTRGTPIYTENFADIYTKGFKAAAVFETADATDRTDDLAQLFSYVSTATDGVGLWQHSYDSSTPWPAEGTLRYFLAAPVVDNEGKLPAYLANLTCGGTEEDEVDNTLTFSLTNYPTAATGQYDVLFTSKDIAAPTSQANATYPILFYHAFTGVKFKLGNAGDDITAITKVEMTNMLNAGTCTVTPNYTDANTSKGGNNSNASKVATDPSKSAQCVAWNTTGATKTTFSQTFGDFSEGHTYTADNSNFAESFYSDNTAKDNLNDAAASMTFFCIPQTFTYNASNTTGDIILTVTYTLNDGTAKTRQVDFTKTLNGKTWKAGELYTYTLTVNDVEVEVTDDMSTDKLTKSNVAITNTGNCDAYLRAAIVGNWFDSKGKIVNVAWSIDQTQFVGLPGTAAAGSSDGSWVQGTDGFFYYTKPVQAGKATNTPLFTSYTTGLCNGYASAKLEITIAAQAVQKTKIATALSNGWAPGVTLAADATAETPKDAATE